MTTANPFKLFTVLLLGSLACSAQSEDFAPLSKDAARSKGWVEKATARFQQDLGQLQGTHKKYLAEIYKERYESVKSILESKEIITDPTATAYLSALSAEIIRVNPLLKATELRIVFSNDISPNASSQGEGTLLFHVGLFNRLQNESEVAFVLCHELAHYYLDHSNKSIENYVNIVYSDAFQKELKNIKKSEYGQNKQLIALGKSLTFRNRKHSRDHEQAADSLALVFLKNTAYDLEGAITTLQFLDTVDQDKFHSPLDLAKRFHFESAPFRKSWVEADDVLAFTSHEEKKDKGLEDSLKTHPDCALRIEKLKPAISQYNNASRKKFIVSQERFEKLKKQFDFNILEYCFDVDAVSHCLHFTLQMLNSYPDNAYLHTMVGRCLNELYDRQKNHRLHQVTELPGPHHDKEYNQLLQLIQNVRLRDFASLSYHYLQQHKSIAEKDKRFAAVFQKSTENFINQ